MSGTNMFENHSGLKKVLISGQRPEICKLFEMLMSQQDRLFVRSKGIGQCFDLAVKTRPALIIIDCTMLDPRICHAGIATLKESAATAGIPILIISDPEYADGEASTLRDIAEGVLSEPFNPAEIKKMVEEYL